MVSFLACLVFVLPLVRGCYVGDFIITECGTVGEPTRVSVVFMRETGATGWANWGDVNSGPIIGFDAATNDTMGGVQLIDTGDDYELTLEHVYSKAGTYSISFEITVYRNETIDRANRCLTAQKPRPEDQWLLTVSENGCKHRIRSSALPTKGLLWTLAGFTVMSVALFL